MFAYTQENGAAAICGTERGVPSGAPFIEVVGELPARAYRDAWVISGDTVVVDYARKVPIVTGRIQNAIQQTLDAQAAALGYDNIVSAASYAGSSHPKFGPEGDAMKTWRDGCWDKAYAMLADWQAGNIPDPTVADVLAALPVYEAA